MEKIATMTLPDQSTLPLQLPREPAFPLHLFARQVANDFWPEGILTTGIDCIIGKVKANPQIATTNPKIGSPTISYDDCKTIDRIILKIYRLHRQAAGLQEKRPDYKILSELDDYECILLGNILPSLPRFNPRMTKIEISQFLKRYHELGFPSKLEPFENDLIKKALPKLPRLHSNMSLDEENEFSNALWIEEPNIMFNLNFLSHDRRFRYFEVLENLWPAFFKDPHYVYLFKNKKITVQDIQEVNLLIESVEAQKYLRSKGISFKIGERTTKEIFDHFFEIDEKIVSSQPTLHAPFDITNAGLAKEDPDDQQKRGSEKYWTPEKLAEILESKNAGKTVKEIANEHDVSETLIYEKLKLAKNQKCQPFTGFGPGTSIFSTRKN